MKRWLTCVMLVTSLSAQAEALNCHAVMTLAEQSMRYTSQNQKVQQQHEAELNQTLKLFEGSQLKFAQAIIANAKQQRVARSLQEHQRMTQFFMQKWYQKCMHELKSI